MSNREPKPCPNPKCGEQAVGPSSLSGEFTDTDGIVTVWFVQCYRCSLVGPNADTPDAALDLWDALPRREDFHAELCECFHNQDFVTLERIDELWAKYAPITEGVE